MPDDPASPSPLPSSVSRRKFLSAVSALSALAATGSLRAEEPAKIDKRALQAAEELLGLEFSDAERDLMLEGLAELREDYRRIREVALANDVPPAFRFDPLPAGAQMPAGPDAVEAAPGTVASRPAANEDLAYLSVTDLARLMQGREISSVELTRLYLDRIRELDPLLHAVISSTEERALRAAETADREIAAGRYLGVLHGIPWGAKDLLATSGYPTTWGATPYRDQVIPYDATVVERLDAAGAVLVAKLTLGALAWGDVWYGEKTRNPWNPEQGSSGSSAGPAAATAAGMVGFSIGSETWGSIVSPSTTCGVTGLRPTFGRVSRHGAMALSWTMDKLGPICRTVEDCALVFAAIHGPDGMDPTVVRAPFAWGGDRDPLRLRVGYVKGAFEATPEEGMEESHRHDQDTLRVLRDLGFELVPIELPDLPVSALSFILSAEAGAAFDDLTRSGRDDELVRQIANAWPNVFRQARTIPAVEYIQANRVRTLLMRQMDEALRDVDVYVAPSFGGDNLLLTNLTGHPTVVVPNGFKEDGTPTSISFLARLYRDEDALLLAKTYQDATDWHRRHPDL